MRAVYRFISALCLALVTMPALAVPPGFPAPPQQVPAGPDGYFPVACRTGAAYAANSNSAQTIASRMRHILPYGAIDVELVYPGWKLSPSEGTMIWPAAAHFGVEPVWGTNTLWGAVGSGAGVVRRGQKMGAVDLQVPSDDYFVTDPISINAAAGTAIGSRVYVPSSTGIYAGRTKQGALIEYSTVGTGLDNSWGGAYSGTGGLNTEIQPLVILGRAPDHRRHPALVIVGDSNAWGDVSIAGPTATAEATDADGNSGIWERSLACGVAWSNFSAPGDRLGYLMNSSGGANGRRYSRLHAIQSLGFSHVLQALDGTNDVIGAGLTAAQFEDIWINWTTELVGTGLHVWCATPLPNATSTDTFATQGNQTGNAAIRDIAAWIRTNGKSYGCEKIIDLNARVADPTNTANWRTDLISTLGAPPSYDGTHPSQAMLNWIATQGLLSASMFPQIISYGLDLPATNTAPERMAA